MKKGLAIGLKIGAGVGATTFAAGGIAGIVIGSKIAHDKKKNAELHDNGYVSKFSNHLFDQPGLKGLSKGNINVLNIGDSIAHGDYTWQILDKIREKGNKHFLKDGPPRAASYYEFLIDALAKNKRLDTDYKYDPDTSVSGMRAFEALKWLSTGQYKPLENEIGSNGVRAERTSKKAIEQHGHTVVNEDAHKILPKLKNADLVTFSIGGNDLIRAIKLFGEPFNDSFDTSDYGEKLKNAKKLSDVISLDFDKLTDIFKEIEQNVEGILQMIHSINPQAKVIMFDTAFPFMHAPKVVRNLLLPMYDKIRDAVRRAMKINVVKNKGGFDKDGNSSKNGQYSKDVWGHLHSMIDQRYLEVSNDKANMNDKSKGVGLNWATYAAIDYSSPNNGDPNDIYKVNSLDIHPTIEGQGKIALAIIKQLNDKWNLGIDNTKYNQTNIDNRIKFIRELHHPTTQYASDAEFQTAWTTLTKKYKVGKFKTVPLSPDSAYDVPMDKNGKTGIAQEKENDKFYNAIRGLYGIIDDFTDRILPNRNLVLKDLDFKNTGITDLPKSFDDYVKVTKGLAKTAKAEYLKHPNKGSADKIAKLWSEEAIDWYIYKNSTKKTNAMKAYVAATALLKKHQLDWDLDLDGRYTLSDLQLGQISSIKWKNFKDLKGINGKIDQVVPYDDFDNMWTRAFTNAWIGSQLRVPTINGKGYKDMKQGTRDAMSIYSGAHKWDTEHNIKSNQDRATEIIKHINNRMTDVNKFLNDHGKDFTDWINKAKDWLKDLKIAANPNVVHDFMHKLVTDWNFLDQVNQLIINLLGNQHVRKTIIELSKGKLGDFTVRMIATALGNLNDEIKVKLPKASQDKKDEWAGHWINAMNTVLNSMSNGKFDMVNDGASILLDIQKAGKVIGITTIEKLIEIIKSVFI